MKLLRCLVVGLIALACVRTEPSLAQSPPANPPMSYGQVPTVGQWVNYFQQKQDTLGFVPLNTAGGSLTGKLTTTASTLNRAGLALSPGVAPTSPINGDLWITASGFYAQVNNVTVGPIASVAGSQSPNVVYASPNGLSGTPTFRALVAADVPLLTATQMPAYTGDVTSSVGSTVNAISANAVTNAKAAQMATLTIKSNITGGSTNPADNSLTSILDAIFGTSQGQIIYRGASGWAALPPGTSGNFLKTLGAAANPQWAAFSGVTSVTCNGTAITSTGTCSTVGQVPGETSNGTATAGNVGQEIISTVLVGSAITLPITTATNLTSITLTGGDWDVSTNIVTVHANATTISNISCSISTTSATPNLISPFFSSSAPYTSAGSGVSQVIAPVRISVASSTTYWAVCQGITGGPGTFYGTLRARRMR